jgi:hypothetical protein
MGKDLLSLFFFIFIALKEKKIDSEFFSKLGIFKEFDVSSKASLRD